MITVGTVCISNRRENSDRVCNYVWLKENAVMFCAQDKNRC